MALNDLSLSITIGVQGRPFRSSVIGLTAGSEVSIEPGATPGFSFTNGYLSHLALPYEENVTALRERLPSGETKVTYLTIEGSTAASLAAMAIATIPEGRIMTGFRVAATRQEDGSDVWSVYVNDTVGATTSTTVAAPRNVTPPSISGTPVVGQSLTAISGVWDGTPPLEVIRQWLRNGTAISGANGATYIVDAADAGNSLSVMEDATNPVGNAQATSAAVMVPVPYDTDAQAYFTAVGEDNLGLAAKEVINTLVLGLKNKGFWDKLDRIGLFKNYSQAASLIDLRHPSGTGAKIFVPINSPSWSEDGWSAPGNNSTLQKVISTNEPIGKSGNQFRQGSAMLYVAMTVAPTVNGAIAYSASSSTGRTHIALNGGATGAVTASTLNGAGIGTTPANASGFPQRLATTYNGTDGHIYRNGADVHTASGVSDAVPVNANFQLLGGSGSYSDCTIGFYASGACLTATEIKDFDDLVSAYLKANFDEGVSLVDDSLATNGFPSLSGGQSLVIQGTYNKFDGQAPTALQVAVVQDSGTVVAKQPAEILSAGDGAWTARVSSPVPMDLLASQNPEVRVWVDGAADPLVKQFKPTPFVKIQPNIPSFNYGSNVYYAGVDHFTDLSAKIQWRCSDPSAPTDQFAPLWNEETKPYPQQGGTLDANGVLAKWSDGSTGAGMLQCNFPRMVFADRANIEFEIAGLPATTWLEFIGSGMTITVDGKTGANPRFEYDSATATVEMRLHVPNIPVGGISIKNITIKPADDPGTHYCTAGERLAKTGTGLIRFMQGDNINCRDAVPYLRDVFPGMNIINFKGMTPGDQSNYGIDVKAGVCTDLGCDMWFNVPRDATETWVTNAATYLRDNFAGKVWVEYANERWNNAKSPFIETHFFCAARAFERGFDTTTTPPTATDDRTCISEYDLWTIPYNAFDLTANATINDGEIFPINMSLPIASAFGLTGVWYVRVPLNISKGVKLSPSNVQVLAQLSATEIQKWVPFDNNNGLLDTDPRKGDKNVWIDIPANTYFVVNITADTTLANSYTPAKSGFYYAQTTNVVIPAGTHLSASNLSLLSNQLSLPVYKYGIVREKEIHDIFYSVFGAAAPTRIVRIHADNGANPSYTSSGRTPQAFADLFAWFNNPNKFDKYCMATYMSNTPAGYQYIPGNPTDHGNPGYWDNPAGVTDFPGWTTTEKAYFSTETDRPRWVSRFLYATDPQPTTNQEALVLNGPTGMMIKADVYYNVWRAHEIERLLRQQAGYTPNSMTMCSYETGWQTSLDLSGGSGYALGGKPYTAAFDAYEALVNDPATEYLVKYFYSFWRDHIGNCHNQFTDNDEVQTEASDSIKRYSLQKDLFDTGAPMLAGYRRAHGIMPLP